MLSNTVVMNYMTIVVMTRSSVGIINEGKTEVEKTIVNPYLNVQRVFFQVYL